MQIKIDIDVKPEELRRFLGLPDVVGMQEEIVNFLRDKVGAASESFDPASFVKENLQVLRNSAAWRKVFTVLKTEDPAAAAGPAPRAASKRRKAAAGAPRPGRARKRAAAAAPASEPPA